MPSNKENERRIAVLEELVNTQAKALVTFGTSIENLNVGLEGFKKMAVQTRNIAGELPYISLKWDSVTKLWTAQLVQSANEEQLDFVVVVHDTAAQAFQILLQKLQRKVS